MATNNITNAVVNSLHYVHLFPENRTCIVCSNRMESQRETIKFIVSDENTMILNTCQQSNVTRDTCTQCEYVYLPEPNTVQEFVYTNHIKFMLRNGHVYAYVPMRDTKTEYYRIVCVAYESHIVGCSELMTLAQTKLFCASEMYFMLAYTDKNYCESAIASGQFTVLENYQ